ncbi:hypothetical protein [Gordonia sp. (in: high G+C Gram-positive bacteria)]|uniref:hypothetical protein n=1 Tax=Gordonia sp. (in: high G+C Gram-positive bacteria) TaxID=84139 RepID=UPI00333FC744
MSRRDSNAALYAPRTPSRLGRMTVPDGARVAQFVVANDNPKTNKGRGPKTIVAAAQVLGGKKVDRKIKRPGQQDWQRQAWALRNEIGELRFIGDRQARACSQVRVFIGRKATPDSDPAPVEPNSPAGQLSKALFGNAAATEQDLKRAAQHLIFTGESNLLITEDGNGGFDWSAHSSTELTGAPGKWKLTDGLTPRDIDEDKEVLIRAWNPDPEKSAMADAPVRAVLPVARELRALTMYVSAQVDSRLAGGGVLFVPQGIQSSQPVGEDGSTVPFGEELTDYMIEAIRDRDSAASVAPLVVELPSDLIDKVKHVTFASPLDSEAPGLRDESIRRIGLGMDSDPSVLLGQASSNHWSAWAVDENEVKYGVLPVVSTICHALTIGLVQPLLQSEGVADASSYVVWYDATPLQVRPDRSKDAQTLYDKEVISAETLRRESGFDDSDIAADDEVEARKLWQLLQMRPDWADKILPRLGIYLDDVGGAPESADEAQTGDETQTTSPLDSPTGEAPPPDNSPPTMETPE